jgi:hypothetical protein
VLYLKIRRWVGREKNKTEDIFLFSREGKKRQRFLEFFFMPSFYLSSAFLKLWKAGNFSQRLIE